MIKTIKLPKLVGTKRVSPYMQLYKYIQKHVGKCTKGCKMNQSAVWVNEETGDILDLNEKEWFYKRERNKIFVDRSFPFHSLNYSPAVKEGIQNGYAKVDVKKFYIKKAT